MEIFNLLNTHLPDELFKLFQNKIFEEYGISLDNSKVHFVKNRINRRLKELQINSYEKYLNYIKENEEELFNALISLTTGESSFFRDEKQWKEIEKLLIDYISDYIAKPEFHQKKYIHIWSAACSKGYEPYTISIILRELFGSKIDDFNIKILASDINTDLLKAANTGFFTYQEIKNIDKTLIDKYFYKGGLNDREGFFVSPEIKKPITFAKINLVEPFKFNKNFDFVFLKNVLIYFPVEIKNIVTKKISSVIKENGYLVLGTSENLFNKDTELQLLKNHIYIKKNLIEKDKKINSIRNYSINYENKNFQIQKQYQLNILLKNYSKKFLNLGEYFVSGEPLCISTVLGSCVSVCLFDENTKIGAMNHFMLPFTGNIADPYKKFELEKYGFWAMEFMLNDMLKKGAKKKEIKAKIFGGANISQTESAKYISKSNIEFALNYLKNENIPIISQDIEKNYARRIYFLTDSGKVYLLKIKTLLTEKEILKYEEDESIKFMKKIDKNTSTFEEFEN